MTVPDLCSQDAPGTTPVQARSTPGTGSNNYAHISKIEIGKIRNSLHSRKLTRPHKLSNILKARIRNCGKSERTVTEQKLCTTYKVEINSNKS